ncbi:MAG: hypothetical protein GY928_13985 [Colwellia sp.]|nr:hypothetical protein [Colwellia sp.]
MTQEMAMDFLSNQYSAKDLSRLSTQTSEKYATNTNFGQFHPKIACAKQANVIREDNTGIGSLVAQITGPLCSQHWSGGKMKYTDYVAECAKCKEWLSWAQKHENWVDETLPRKLRILSSNARLCPLFMAMSSTLRRVVPEDQLLLNKESLLAWLRRHGRDGGWIRRNLVLVLPQNFKDKHNFFKYIEQSGNAHTVLTLLSNCFRMKVKVLALETLKEVIETVATAVLRIIQKCVIREISTFSILHQIN